MPEARGAGDLAPLYAKHIGQAGRADVSMGAETAPVAPLPRDAAPNSLARAQAARADRTKKTARSRLRTRRPRTTPRANHRKGSGARARTGRATSRPPASDPAPYQHPPRRQATTPLNGKQKPIQRDAGQAVCGTLEEAPLKEGGALGATPSRRARLNTRRAHQEEMCTTAAST